MKKERLNSIRCIIWKEGICKRKENLRTKENCGQPERDYRHYKLNAGQWFLSLSGGILGAAAIAYICYRSKMVFLLLVVPASIFSQKYLKNHWKEKRQNQLEMQFKEAIGLLSAALSAGYSVENAVESCRRELELMYGKQGMLTREFSYMSQQMRMNRTIETLMNDFADRSGLEDVENFANIFKLAKRSGGQLVPIIAHTAQIMEDRFRVKEEIRTLTASRQFEQKVMNLMPFLIILYVNFTSPGFFDVIYTTAAGRIIMTLSLAVYILSCYLSSRILDIQIG